MGLPHNSCTNKQILPPFKQTSKKKKKKKVFNIFQFLYLISNAPMRIYANRKKVIKMGCMEQELISLMLGAWHG